MLGFLSDFCWAIGKGPFRGAQNDVSLKITTQPSKSQFDNCNFIDFYSKIDLLETARRRERVCERESKRERAREGKRERERARERGKKKERERERERERKRGRERDEWEVTSDGY